MLAPAVTAPSPPVLTKEYIYAGDRLVAIEDQGATAGSAPTLFVATAQANGQVSLAWTAPVSGGTIDHYEVERTEDLSGTSPNQFNCAAPNCSDTTALGGKVYLYHVRAVFAGGTRSAYSNQDLALTYIFTDDPLNPNGARTTIKAQHFTELRDAINALRVAVNLSPFGWTTVAPATETTPHQGGRIFASHYNDLRTNLAEALSKLGLPGPQSPSVPGGNTVLVTANPVQELRNLMR